MVLFTHLHEPRDKVPLPLWSVPYCGFPLELRGIHCQSLICTRKQLPREKLPKVSTTNLVLLHLWNRQIAPERTMLGDFYLVV